MGSKLRILFVDDDPNETVLVETAVRKLQCAIQVSSVGSGGARKALQLNEAEHGPGALAQRESTSRLLPSLRNLLDAMENAAVMTSSGARYNTTPVCAYTNATIAPDSIVQLDGWGIGAGRAHSCAFHLNAALSTLGGSLVVLQQSNVFAYTSEQNLSAIATASAPGTSVL